MAVYQPYSKLPYLYCFVLLQRRVLIEISSHHMEVRSQAGGERERGTTAAMLDLWQWLYEGLAIGEVIKK